MAGEIEDCLSLQADSLPTGSISFGRFEVESLSWERRSSFSHNRYLEEVEKYSTPGSVTQKKAYFEAHFKKKALLRQASSVSPNGDDWQTTENGIEDHVYMEDYVDHGNTGQPQFSWNDETSAVLNELEHDEMESNGGKIEFSWYDETPPAASDDEYDIIESSEGQLHFQYDEGRAPSDVHQHDVIDCKQELNSSASELPIEPMLFNSMKVLDYPIELAEIDKLIENQSMSNKDSSHEVVDLKSESGSVNVGELPELCDFSSKNSMAEKDNAPRLMETQESTGNVSATLEHKSLKAKLRTIVPVAQTTRKTSIEKKSLSSFKAFTRTSRETEGVYTLRTKTQKQSFLKVPQSTSSDSKNFKPKDSENLKAQASQGTRSGKCLGAKKDGVSPQSTGIGGTFVPEDRPENIVYSTKTNLTQSNAAFKFRSDQRAEKRKEFIMRLGEKFHAKELQMNEIQARTQVQTEAEIKQLRRSLNFKATPMPSFYHEAVPRDSDGKKMVVKQAKPPNLRSQSTSPGRRAAARANSTSKAANRGGGPALGEPVGSNHVDCPTASGFDTGRLIVSGKPGRTDDQSRGVNRPSRSRKKIGGGKKEESGKPVVQQQQRGERKAKKGERVGLVRSLAVHVAS